MGVRMVKYPQLDLGWEIREDASEKTMSSQKYVSYAMQGSWITGCQECMYCIRDLWVDLIGNPIALHVDVKRAVRRHVLATCDMSH